MGHSEISISVIRKTQPPGYRFDTRDYDQTQLIYVTEGLLYCEGQESEAIQGLTPGMFVLLRLDGVFTLSCRKEGYQGIGVVLTGQLPAALQGAAITGIADSRLRLLVEMLFRHMDAPLPESAYVLRGLGQALVWEVLVLTRERRTPEGRDWAAAARTAIELNLGTGIPVRHALASLPLSYRQLGRCFRERYGTSPKEYQELLRIDEACRLLTSTPLEITSIAIELGYSSSQHFAARFRRLAGCTPTEYREQQRKDS